VFDIGGVLLDWNPRYLYRKLFDDEREMEWFLDHVCTMQWHSAHDRGVPFGRSSAALAAVHPEYAELISAWGARSEEMVAGELAEVVALLAELKDAGVRCYALTNMEAETFPLRRQRYDFFGWFDGIVVSAYEGIAKPDPEIFLRVLGRFGLSAQRTVLIDDSAANVEAARRVCMQAVQFSDAARLREWLVAAGLLVDRQDGAVRPS
jgi:2-haloacid dehalogenase